MRVIIAGGRGIHSDDVVALATASSGFDITSVVCGGAPGVDAAGKRWADKHNIPVRIIPAQWDVYGKMVGPIRNRAMAQVADALILVWDGESRGSANMLKVAQEEGLAVYEHRLYGDANG